MDNMHEAIPGAARRWTLAILFAAAVPALAQPAKPEAPPKPAPVAPERSAAAGAGGVRDDGRLFDRLDVNRDGVLSREELARDPAQRENWLAVDRNRDGRITRDEFTRIAP